MPLVVGLQKQIIMSICVNQCLNQVRNLMNELSKASLSEEGVILLAFHMPSPGLITSTT